MNIKNVTKGFLLLAFLVGAVIASPVSAQNVNANVNAFINAHASLKADALIRLESSVGVVLGPNNALRVMGAKVTSISNNEISVSAPFGNSALNFVVKVDANSKLNGKVLGSEFATSISPLKAGDIISFAGTITSSTSSSIVVDGDHLVSRALYKNGKIEDKTSFKGEVKAVNVADNSFTVKLPSDRTVKVSVSSSTVITLDGVAKTLSSLKEGDEVKIEGEINADGSVITASKVTIDSDDNNDDNDDEDEEDDDDDDDKNENKGGWFGKFRNWFWK